ncbi:MAG TPA: PQQ-dependent sugar dehydrogenase [Acidimicrobiia bacterium]|nr:PQQ-dependent sugar dehydrogenase [Acidimicrobiia bacterium]
MRRTVGLVVIAIWMASLPAAASQPGGSFIDDDGSVHESAIEAIRVEGITAGCDLVGDRFCPGMAVTRAELAAFVIRALSESPTPASVGSFADVPPDAWYAGFVERLVSLDLVRGYGDGTFRPDGAVTRGEMAVVLVRMLGESPSPGTGFVDVPSDAFYAGHVQRLAELGVTNGCATDPPRFCPSGAVTRAEMASFLARGLGLDLGSVTPRPSLEGVGLRRVLVASGLDQPLFVAAPAGDDRLFALERGGRVLILRDGEMSSIPFLDLGGLVSTGGEGGALGLAFHPDHAANGLLYVHYTDRDGANRVVEYGLTDDPDLADPDSARLLLTVSQPAANHNGGMIDFGPDGRLYVGIGDGGGAGDPFRHGQNPATRLGTITAVDVASGQAFLFAYGLRNPWRFAWDGLRIYIGDVGQSTREEIDVLSIFEAGSNLGWSVMEGSRCVTAGCSTAGLVLPVVEYTHAEGCSVTGGVVYRGSSVPALVGHYLYGDFCSGFVRTFRYTGEAADARDWQSLRTDGLVSFGTDGHGEVYLVSIHGTVWRIEPST